MSRHREQFFFDPAELTFGLEFEFAIKFRHVHGSNTSEHDAQDYVASFLNARVPNATVLSYRQYCNAQRPLAEGEALPLATEWILTTDGTINFWIEQEQSSIAHFCFELRSPVLRYRDVDPLNNQVSNVLHVLNTNFDVLINNTCSFHVHVGRALDGFNLHPLRNIMATLWTFEAQISAIHPPPRRQNTFSNALRTHSPIAREVLHQQWTSEVTLNRLFDFRSINELVNSYSHEEPLICKMSYEVGFLREPFPVNEHMKRTLEFRQHAGTTDYQEVWRWVSFIRDLTVWAHRRHPDYVRHFLRRYVARQPYQYSFHDLCHEIGTRIPPRG